MMPDQQEPHYSDLSAAARRMLSAHAAVEAGIATHAEKHRAAMHAAREKLAAERRLAEGAQRHAAGLPSRHY